MKISNELKELSSCFGGELFVVGGFVRNAVLGFSNTDIDLCGKFTPTEVEGLLKDKFKVILDYASFGSVLILGKDCKYEYTTFRKDSYKNGEHRPFEVAFTKDIVIDAKRRDFTANALYFNIEKNQILDPTGYGLIDTKNKVLRACRGEQTFLEDGLRLLRLVRISGELGFKIEEKTFEYAKAHSHLLKDIKAERKREELNKILVCETKYNYVKKDSVFNSLILMTSLNLWQYLIPEMTMGQGIKQNPKYHKYNVLEHIFYTTMFADKSIRLSALLHDIGKAQSYFEDGNFYRHPQIGAELTRKILGQSGLKYSKKEIDEVVFLVENHMIDLNLDMSEKKIRLFLLDNFKYLDKLILLKNADAKGSGMGATHKKFKEKWTAIYKQMKKENVPFDARKTNLCGDEVILAIGENNAKFTSEILKSLRRKIAVGILKNENEMLFENVLKTFKEVKNG